MVSNPDGFSYSSAISCCGAEGRWEEALELMEVMQRADHDATKQDCLHCRHFELWKGGKVEDASDLRQMKDEGLAADRVATTLFCFMSREEK
jgi:pentatricopeptide repeat protein